MPGLGCLFWEVGSGLEAPLGVGDEEGSSVSSPHRGPSRRARCSGSPRIQFGRLGAVNGQSGSGRAQRITAVQQGTLIPA